MFIYADKGVMKTFIFCISILLASASVTQIRANSQPRKDLYKKITATTGVSLRQAYDAVFKNDKMAKLKLYQHASLKDTKKIERGIQDEVTSYEQRCKKEKKKNKIACNSQVDDLKKQLKFVKNLNNEVKKNPRLGLYRNLMLLSYTVRHEVLKSEYKKWDQKCSAQNRINTLECKMQFYEIDLPYDLLRRLTQVAYLKAENKRSEINKNKINKEIARYEL